jgi:hypothetical protein
MLRIAKKADHRPADPREARKLVSELRAIDAPRALDQVIAWLETLTALPEVRLDRRFDSISIFEEAAMPFEKRITRDYIRSARLQSSQEQRLWATAHDLWHQLGVSYHLCMMEYEASASGAASMRSWAPVMGCRAMRALRHELRWTLLRYGDVEERLWQDAARIYRMAESRDFAREEVAAHSGRNRYSTVEREFVKMLLLAVSSPNSLPPAQLDIAARLAARCAEFVPIETVHRADVTHSFDLGKNAPPQRGRDAQDGSALRYLASAAALPQLERVSKELVHSGGADSAQAAAYDPRMLREVALHLALYWSANPLGRESERHPTMARISVVPGFRGLLDALQGYIGGPFIDDEAESWMAENVSRGGYGAVIAQVKGDWVRVGSLVGIKPESAPVWGVGVIRRMTRDDSRKRHVGIESLTKAAIPVCIAPVGSLGSGSGPDHFPNAAVLGLSLKDSGEVGIIMEAGGFSPRLTMEMVVRGAQYLLTPIGFVQGGDDFDLARYRILRRDAVSPD